MIKKYWFWIRREVVITMKQRKQKCIQFPCPWNWRLDEQFFSQFHYLCAIVWSRKVAVQYNILCNKLQKINALRESNTIRPNSRKWRRRGKNKKKLHPPEQTHWHTPSCILILLCLQSDSWIYVGSEKWLRILWGSPFFFPLLVWLKHVKLIPIASHSVLKFH